MSIFFLVDENEDGLIALILNLNRAVHTLSSSCPEMSENCVKLLYCADNILLYTAVLSCTIQWEFKTWLQVLVVVSSWIVSIQFSFFIPSYLVWILSCPEPVLSCPDPILCCLDPILSCLDPILSCLDPVLILSWSYLILSGSLSYLISQLSYHIPCILFSSPYCFSICSFSLLLPPYSLFPLITFITQPTWSSQHPIHYTCYRGPQSLPGCCDVHSAESFSCY